MPDSRAAKITAGNHIVEDNGAESNALQDMAVDEGILKCESGADLESGAANGCDNYHDGSSATGKLYDATQYSENEVNIDITDDCTTDGINGSLQQGNAAKSVAGTVAVSSAVVDTVQIVLQDITNILAENMEILSNSFSDLASNSTEQGRYIQDIIDVASGLQLEDEKISLDEFHRLFNATLSDVISKILQVSQMAMEMTYSMDDAMKMLASISSNMSDIQKITKQTNMLALNALIEAEKAGESGKGFAIVAQEVKTISKDISQVSVSIKQRIETIDQTMKTGYEKLRDLATTDMSANILAKEKLEKLTDALFQQNEDFKEVLGESAAKSHKIASNISKLTISLQFQDRVAQYIQNISGLLDKLQHKYDDTIADYEITEGDINDTDIALIRDMLEGILLSELRDIFTNSLAETASLTAIAHKICTSPISNIADTSRSTTTAKTSAAVAAGAVDVENNTEDDGIELF